MTKEPRIRVIYGPLSKKVKRHCIVWGFSGYRESGEFCRWFLTFYFDSRRFSTNRAERTAEDERLDGKFELFGDTAHRPIRQGRITPMLRELVPKHDFAEAVAKAILR